MRSHFVFASTIRAALALALACAAPSISTTCAPTPIAAYQIGQQTRWGPRGGDVFFQIAGPNGTPYQLRASKVETILLILANPLTPPPNTIDVDGRELSSVLRKTFITRSTESSEYPHGTGWIGNYEFPRAGCWELSVVVPRNTGKIVVRVEP